jgi:thiamine biosynthesis protein ThiS
MQVTINGKGEELDDGATVGDLLRRLEVEPIRVAVEVNRELVTRATFDQTVIHSDDRIEIVTFVGGG